MTLYLFSLSRVYNHGAVIITYLIMSIYLKVRFTGKIFLSNTTLARLSKLAYSDQLKIRAYYLKVMWFLTHLPSTNFQTFFVSYFLILSYSNSTGSKTLHTRFTLFKILVPHFLIQISSWTLQISANRYMGFLSILSQGCKGV